ncbi:MAG: flagellar export protein FliJ [Proteobacteria bacterium]|nr:flagellar export protein FliJ [Pseudomonadota bacterium]
MFHFRLQAVETIRRNKEELVQLKLGREQTILQNHQTRLADFKVERRNMLASLAVKEKKKIKGAMIQFYMEAVRSKEVLIQMLENTIASQEQVVKKIRLELIKAVQQRKIVEVIRKRDYEEFLAEQRKKEQNESDEMAVLRFGRSPN